MYEVNWVKAYVGLYVLKYVISLIHSTEQFIENIYTFPTNSMPF